MRWWDGSRWTNHVSGWGGSPPASGAGTSYDAARAWLVREEAAARWLRPLLVLWPIALAVWSAGVAHELRAALDGTDTTSSGWTTAGDLGALLSLALLVARVLWLRRAGEVARSLGLHLARTPLASALGWIVPILNYWWPYQGVRDLFPEGERPQPQLGWWWACWVTSSVVAALAGLASAYASAGLAGIAIAVTLVPAIAGAVLEIHLIDEAGAVHRRLADGNGEP
jgi:hypothetical protein